MERIKMIRKKRNGAVVIFFIVDLWTLIPFVQISYLFDLIQIDLESTGKSFSETLILAWQKIAHGNSMNNLLSYWGLIDAKIRASDKDSPVSFCSTDLV